jgi:hypothetical protein
LWYHVSQIQETDKGRLTAHGDIAIQVADMQRLCRGVRRDSPAQQFGSIVSAAYDKRLTLKGRLVPEEYKKAVRAISMLGRLRAAYECFKSVALTFDDIRNLEMEPANPSQPFQVNTSLFQKLLQQLSVRLELPKGILEEVQECIEPTRPRRNADSGKPWEGL